MICKIYKDDDLLLECDEKLLFTYLKKFGDTVTIRITFEEGKIVFLEADNDFNRSELTSIGMNKSNKEKYKRKSGYIDEIGYKFCTKCELSKPLDEFGYRKNSKDGRHRVCKKCYNTSARRRYRRNKG